MKEPQYYIKRGYEDHGYVSPKLSSTAIYPDYIKKEVDRCVEKIQFHQKFDTVTFAFMTDLHYALSYNHKIRLKRTLNAYKEIAKRAHIDKLILGGDYVNDGCKRYRANCFRELRALFDGIKYYPINGNHDDGTIWDYQYLKAEKSKNHFTREERYRLFYNHLPLIGAEFDKGNYSLYYMYNDIKTKTRYIFLDMIDIPYKYDKNGKLVYLGQWLYTMSQKQVNWLLNIALKFEEEGWSIVFAMHSAPFPTANKEEYLFKYATVVRDIADAYKKGENIKANYFDGEFETFVDAEFSKYIRGDIICFVVGDYHTDKIEYSANGIPYIFTANAVMYCNSSPNYVQRYDGDKTEILFDVMTLNKKKRRIYITRVGAGEDREIFY